MLRRIEVMVKIRKKVGGGPEVGCGGQGGCEQRIEVIVKMQKKGRRGVRWCGQGGCEHRIEGQRAITKKKKFFKFHQIIFSLYSISCSKFLASNTNTFRNIAYAMSKISKRA